VTVNTAVTLTATCPYNSVGYTFTVAP
jgi:hypothetical protein